MASQVESIKKIPGTPFMVDGFAFSGEHCRHYFLTHCHSDHTIGLRRSFDLGTIYCTPVSARILHLDYGLGPPRVVPLQLNVRVVIEGIRVTPLDANHCPGACMFLFEVPGGAKGDSSSSGSSGQRVTRILHTGDCRWQPRLRTGTVLSHVPVDVLYLDTTYCKPIHTFPSQQDAIASMVEVLRGVLAEEPLTLIAMAAYHIGKERAFLGAARGLGIKVYVPAKKLRLLQALDLDPQDLALLTRDQAAAQLHVCNPGMAPEQLQQALQEAGGPWKAIVGVRATGWVYSRSRPLAHWRRLDATCSVLTVPYSEHSSWGDLRECVGSLRPRRVVPTVNAANPEQSRKLVDMFADLMDLRCSRRHMDSYLLRPSPPPPTQGLLPSAAEAVELGACTATPHGAGQADSSGQSPDAPSSGSKLEQSGGPAVSVGVSGTTESWAAGPPSVALALLSAASAASTAAEEASAEGCAAATPAGAAGEGEGLLDLAQVDLQQQQRLMEEVARVQRLRRSLELQREAKKRQRTAGGCGASSVRRRRQQAHGA